MHIHVPKVPHSLAEMIKEVGVIVIGILIALGLEALVEERHWDHAVTDAREALHDEIDHNAKYFVNRLAASKCVAEHIAAAQESIDVAARTGRTRPIEGLWIKLGQRIDRSQWETELAAQSLVHFPRHERTQLSNYYSQVRDLMPWRDDEVDLWDHLSVLEGPSRPISDAELVLLRRDLNHAKRIAYLLELNAGRILTWTDGLGLKRPAADLQWVANSCPALKPGPV